MKFTFKLQAALDHRRFIEDNLKRELSEIRRELKSAEELLTQMIDKELSTREQLQCEQAHGLSSDQVVAYHAYLNRLSTKIESQREEIASISERLIKKQDEVVEAMKNRKILEKLKDKDKARFNADVQRIERNFIDEIAVTQFARKTQNHRGKDE